MFSTSDFQAWAKQDNAVLFAAVMTKIEGRKEDDLLSTYGFRGFPSLAVLDAKGTPITKSLGRSLDAMSSTIEAAPSYMALKAKMDAGKKVDQGAWYMAQLKLGSLELDEAKKGLVDNTLTPEQCEVAEQAVFILEMNSMLRDRSLDQDEAIERVYKTFLAGRRVPAGAMAEGFVDFMLIEAAKKHDDTKAFFHSYERVKAQQEKSLQSLTDEIARLKTAIEADESDARSKQTLGRYEPLLGTFQERLDELNEQAEKFRSKR